MQYKVNIGISWVDEKGSHRYEPGEIANDIPLTSEGWLVAQGCIEPIASPAPPVEITEEGNG